MKISDLTENVDFPNHHTPLVGIEYLGEKIIIDVEDGYWDKSGICLLYTSDAADEL